MSTQRPRIWFITGTSRGFGRSLAEAVAAHGDQVFATARNAASVDTLVAHAPRHIAGTTLDVTDAAAATVAVASAIRRFGRIDVLVNNAGYGLAGAVEEVDEDQIRAQFETNVFGALRLTRLVLPHMRERRSGHILQISSIAGIAASPGLGIYNASKFALEGFSEALADEVAPFGIRVTLIEPGPFRTDWAGPSLATPRHRIDAYAETAHRTIARLNGYSGQQAGDPVRAAAAMIAVVETANPPLHLPLGRWALDRMHDKLGLLARETAKWEARSRATDFTDDE